MAEETIENAQGVLTLSGGVEENRLLARSLFFNTVTNDSLNFNSQITDNWLENNTAIQDHITLSPVTITMKGLIGEVVYTPADAEKDYLKNYNIALGAQIFDFAYGKLNTISSFFPSFSNTTQKAINTINQKATSLAKVESIANTYFDFPKIKSLSQKLEDYAGLTTNVRQEKQRQIVEMLKDYWLNRQSFVAQTPWGEYENMFIQSVNINQANVNYSSEISITLKQVRYATTITTKADKNVLAKYAQVAQANEENYGKAGTENTGLANMVNLPEGIGIKQ